MSFSIPFVSWAQDISASQSRQESARDAKPRHSKSSLNIPIQNPPEKKNLKLSPFPEVKAEDSTEDTLLMLKRRLDQLHHLIYQKP